MATKKKTRAPARRSAAAKPKKKSLSRAKPKRPARRKPESLRLRAVMPSLVANDIHRSLAWYRDIVGFVVEEEWAQNGRLQGATLKAGTVELLISQDDFAKGRDRSKGEGFRLYCTTAQDVDRLAADIKTRGGVLETDPATQPWGARDFSLVDPDGFKVSISSWKM